MGYMIRMGIPEMQELWDDLQQKYRAGTINKDEEKLYKKWGNANVLGIWTKPAGNYNHWFRTTS